MHEWFRSRCVITFIVVVSALFAGLVAAEPTPPDLNKLWEQQMLEGKPSRVYVTVQGSTIEISEDSPKKTLTTVKMDSPRGLWSEPYGINVTKTGEGFWGDRGWSLRGGLLDEVSIGPSRIQLYARFVERNLFYVPIPFFWHRDHPVETGYDFFLLHRKQGIPGAQIIRTWVFPPDEVVLKADGHGGTDSDVQASLHFDASSHVATLRVRGLKKPIEERVDLTSELESALQKPSESGRVNQ
jgi:hypothetical protein